MAVHGSPNAQVNLVTSQASGQVQSSIKQGSEAPPEPGFCTTNCRIGAIVVGVATTIGTVVAVITYVKS
ncbi:hypothetical protein [Streptomyces beijiangensis]|uniref:Uncharacterized protein n=1 Tax=Streptomyces beijiangensis TaxID=163361 RepID=A0A939F528_9ACTN|nr:hypothetical protein [Streptomyces beijiangensis]MBO0512440.1 hypothetical protein [Streptomyces beijiangensis]